MPQQADVDNSQHANNVLTLYREMAWLSQVINQVICSYLKQEGHERHWADIPPPELVSGTPYADRVKNGSLPR